jgi:hypothetical protein
LATLPNQSFNDGNCEPGAYYLVTLRAILARPIGKVQGNRAL